MFQMTVAGSSLAELASNMMACAAALGEPEGSAAQPAEMPSTSRGSAARAPAASPGPKASSRKPAETQSEDGGDELDYETEVRPVVVKLSKTHGREAALEVLGQFETEDGETPSKGQEVQAKDWPALVAACNKAQKRLDKAKAEADD